MTPALSIIIPTLNEEGYIGRLLNSIASQQTHIFFEVLIIDGKSEDLTLAVAQKFISHLHHFQIVKSPKRGISYQRNLGAKHARGNVLLFLDADTVLPRHFITSLMRQLPKTKFFVGTCFPLLNDLNLKTFLLSIISYPLGIYFSWVHKMTLGFCTIASRDIHKQIGGYREELLYAEDTDYGKRALGKDATFVYYWIPSIYFSVRRLVKTGAILWLITKFKESHTVKEVASNENPDYKFGIFNDKI